MQQETTFQGHPSSNGGPRDSGTNIQNSGPFSKPDPAPSELCLSLYGQLLHGQVDLEGLGCGRAVKWLIFLPRLWDQGPCQDAGPRTNRSECYALLASWGASVPKGEWQVFLFPVTHQMKSESTSVQSQSRLPALPLKLPASELCAPWPRTCTRLQSCPMSALRATCRTQTHRSTWEDPHTAQKAGFHHRLAVSAAFVLGGPAGDSLRGPGFLEVLSNQTLRNKAPPSRLHSGTPQKRSLTATSANDSLALCVQAGERTDVSCRE